MCVCVCVCVCVQVEAMCVGVGGGGESCGWVQVKPETVGSNKDGKRYLITLTP